MNKEKYTTPEVEIIAFDTEDIITTSSGFTNGGNLEEVTGNGDISFGN